MRSIYTYPTLLLTLFTSPALGQEIIIDPLRSEPRILKYHTPSKQHKSVSLPQQLDENVGGANYGMVKRRMRYGTYYFDYKFDIPTLMPAKPKNDSAIAHLKGFMAPDTLRHLVICIDPESKWNSDKSTPVETFLNKYVGPHILKPEDLISYQMRNPVKPPVYRKPIAQIYYLKKSRREQIADSLNSFLKNKGKSNN